MPDQTKAIVTNTTPLIALTAATGNETLKYLHVTKLASVDSVFPGYQE